jgi:hypothetical protein
MRPNACPCDLVNRHSCSSAYLIASRMCLFGCMLGRSSTGGILKLVYAKSCFLGRDSILAVRQLSLAFLGRRQFGLAATIEVVAHPSHRYNRLYRVNVGNRHRDKDRQEARRIVYGGWWSESLGDRQCQRSHALVVGSSTSCRRRPRDRSLSVRVGRSSK